MEKKLVVFAAQILAKMIICAALVVSFVPACRPQLVTMASVIELPRSIDLSKCAQETPACVGPLLAVKPDGTLFLSAGGRVYQVDAETRSIEALVGADSDRCSDPDDPACLSGVTGIALLGNELLVADTARHRIISVDLASRKIRQVAGFARTTSAGGFCGDGGPAVAACLEHPTKIAHDPAGNLLIDDHGNKRVRAVDAKGVIATLEDNPSSGADRLMSRTSQESAEVVCVRAGLPVGCVSGPLLADGNGALYGIDTSLEAIRVFNPILTQATSPSVCRPYRPDPGLFLNKDLISGTVNVIPRTVGPYRILRNETTVFVTNSFGTIANVAIPGSVYGAPVGARYHFLGLNNRFLILDFFEVAVTQFGHYQQAFVDLEEPAASPRQGRFLDAVFTERQAQVFVYPSNAAFPGSPNGGAAVLVAYGMGQGEFRNTSIHRSDTGALLCDVGRQNVQIQIMARIESGSVVILDGGRELRRCQLPAGALTMSPTSLSFGTVAPTSSSVRNVTFRNTGSDCLAITSIGRTTNFFSSLTLPAILQSGDSLVAPFTFNPNGATGNLSAALDISTNPSVGPASLRVSGESRAATPPDRPPDPPRPTRSPIGLAEQISTGGIISGWAFDPDEATRSIEVHVYVGGPAGSGEIACITQANLPRPEINFQQRISGDHGFQCQLPVKFADGAAHPVFAYGIDVTQNPHALLAGSPRTLLFGVPRERSGVFGTEDPADRVRWTVTLDAAPPDTIEFRLCQSVPDGWGKWLTLPDGKPDMYVEKKNCTTRAVPVAQLRFQHEVYLHKAKFLGFRTRVKRIPVTFFQPLPPRASVTIDWLRQ